MRLTVRAATRLQLTSLQAKRHQYRMDLAASVAGPGAGVAQLRPLAISVLQAQRDLWHLRWDNHLKEHYWRLVLNGLATAARLHIDSQQCLCSAVRPDRLHHFWACPVARGVVEAMSAQLVGQFALPSGQALEACHVLLMQPPPTAPASIHLGVWQVVCLAALNAMDVGRASTAKWHAQRTQQQRQQRQLSQQLPPDPGQQRITAFFEQRPPSQEVLSRRQQRQQQREAAERQAFEDERQPLLQEAQQAAVVRFWELLADFVAAGQPPPSWLVPGGADHLGAVHPFIHSAASGQASQLALSTTSA